VYSYQLFVKPLGLDTLKYAVEFLILTSTIWEVNRWIVLRFQKRYPHLSQNRRRIMLVIPICWTASILVDWLDMVIVNGTNYHTPYPVSAFSNTVPGALPFSVLIVGAQEAVYYFSRLLKSEKEKETLKKEHLQTQLDSLKQQVNPHFLFNSLSTLSALVVENTKQAEQFIEELASVYRYLLITNEQPLTTLDNELDFIQAYFHLLQMRFGRSIELDVAIDEPYYTYLIPPLTLQLLVENAVKHNKALPDSPLRIRIYSDEANNLFVLNNLQKKVRVLHSSKTGLQNIVAKYRLLNQPDVIIRQTDAIFQVMVPLIETAQFENSELYDQAHQ
jgi:hypothetical protein